LFLFQAVNFSQGIVATHLGVVGHFCTALLEIYW